MLILMWSEWSNHLDTLLPCLRYRLTATYLQILICWKIFQIFHLLNTIYNFFWILFKSFAFKNMHTFEPWLMSWKMLTNGEIENKFIYEFIKMCLHLCDTVEWLDNLRSTGPIVFILKFLKPWGQLIDTQIKQIHTALFFPYSHFIYYYYFKPRAFTKSLTFSTRLSTRQTERSPKLKMLWNSSTLSYLNPDNLVVLSHERDAKGWQSEYKECWETADFLTALKQQNCSDNVSLGTSTKRQFLWYV